MNNKKLKIAILHEMLIKFWWAEKVVETFLKAFPEADLYTLIYDEKKIWKFFPKEKINSQVFKLKSQKIYNLTKKQRFCLAYMAESVEQLDFSNYDIVLCSSSWFAHWAITKPETKFIVYYHSPARYMWDWTNEYKKDLKIPKLIKPFFIYKLNKLLLKLRQWDFIASRRNDVTIANSKNTALRIKKYYKKEAIILYPPIETNRFSKNINLEKTNFNNLSKKFNFQKNNYYIIISALTEFKKIDIAINSFNNLEEKLVIIWDWDYKKELQNLVKKENIVFVWKQFWDDLVALVQNSLGLIFPWEEDFWIVPVETMSAWKPVFALWKWGLLETIIDWITWEFFNSPDWKDFIEKFKKFHKNNLNQKYKKKDCINQSQNFSEKIFIEKLNWIIKNS